jgi:peptidoglycan/LPS O-acetylase OafA/YrhL
MHEKLRKMSAQTAFLPSLDDQAQFRDQQNPTHPRVPVVWLCVTVLAAFAVVPTTHLPWFGPFSNDGVLPQFNAVSGYLVPPGSPAGLVPGTQSWGYLIEAWSLLLAGLATSAAVACAVSRRRRRHRHLRGLLLAVGVASLILVALVTAEFVPHVPFDGPATLGFSWGTLIGLALALASAIGACFAWATLRFHHLWGTHPRRG